MPLASSAMDEEAEIRAMRQHRENSKRVFGDIESTKLETFFRPIDPKVIGAKSKSHSRPLGRSDREVAAIKHNEVKNAFLEPGRHCVRSSLCSSDEVPQGYGYWKDWNATKSIDEERAMAAEHRMKMSTRGPTPANFGGPEIWMGLPFDEAKHCWGFSNWKDLPAEYFAWYNSGDYCSKESLNREADLADRWLLPWNLRGPPGPDKGGPSVWRHLHFRPGTQKWMNRGGKCAKKKAKHK